MFSIFFFNSSKKGIALASDPVEAKALAIRDFDLEVERESMYFLRVAMGSTIARSMVGTTTAHEGVSIEGASRAAKGVEVPSFTLVASGSSCTMGSGEGEKGVARTFSEVCFYKRRV